MANGLGEGRVVQRLGIVASTALSGAGIFVAGSLLAASLLRGNLYCGIGDGCSQVAHTALGTIWGIPLSALGLVVYSIIFFLSFLGTNRFVLFTMVALASLGSLISIFLVGYLTIYVRVFCSWCFASAAIFSLTSLSCASCIDLPTSKSRHTGRTQWFLFVAVALLLLVQIRYLIARPLEEGASRSVINRTSTSALVPSGTPILGSSLASPLVVQFADMECPYCAREFIRLEKAALAGRIRLALRHFPLPGHKGSRYGSCLACLAAEHGLYWRFLHRCFDKLSTDENGFRIAARDIGLDIKGFDKDSLHFRAASTLVARDEGFGSDLKITGVPVVIEIKPDSAPKLMSPAETF